MTITKRQFSHLQAMGIELWQLKNSDKKHNNDGHHYLNIELSALVDTHIFTDILHCLGCSVGEVNCDNNALSIGLLTWQFSEQTDISLTKHHLVTPSINVLKNSPLLKQALWQKLQENSII
ncbi:DNA polymerase III subunit psi [Colwellia hornerae]|uniref:DNA polymerase III subunit psi n=1 Tax=Colwellia hornerae TaxID=89402 RepID=A0A5C6QD98_9GAMM|nr:DNA polymerase III subunit psi [Colwellia hornerae]TWX51705.1 DNA polymerase III subunit psi [Colwellia hornerae]TWX57493.1 DNA polymerase III subunit psi [Colwellia hornerae]TWX66996.1 DNA polymerase III subunit psi [Colwellia hornerae]